MTKSPKVVSRVLNWQAQTITDAETEIRLTVKNEYLRRTPKFLIDEKVKKIIARSVKELTSETLKRNTAVSLVAFYNAQYNEIRRVPIVYYAILPSLVELLNAKGMRRKMPVQSLKREGVTISGEYVDMPNANVYGVPLKEFTEDVRKRVQATVDNLIKQTAKDPDDITGRNSLRNKAEMQVRYEKHLTDITDLKASGAKLVICSTHTDCSERCRPWQGKVYSLDGTSGTTGDGRNYQPLENATDVYYTTKSGKTYKNGLLGFNCRHYLVEYEEGLRFGKQSETKERIEYAITERQREYERDIRRYKVEAIEKRGNDERGYKRAVESYKRLTNEYIEFSKAHGRAYYKSRIRII